MDEEMLTMYKAMTDEQRLSLTADLTNQLRAALKQNMELAIKNLELVELVAHLQNGKEKPIQ